MIGFLMKSGRSLTPRACMSFSARQSGAQIWNPSSRISERRVIVAIRGSAAPWAVVGVGHCSIASMI
ncbi:MAG: hypothetical protein D4R65_14940 [Verrucomicrobiaceae bacterium]|nr:MAG: hypothetical protein D4R65_14940 [Verrucomicrobiaceae bacterium]